MKYAREKLKWNGWGWADQHYDFEGSETFFWTFLQQALGMPQLRHNPPVLFDELFLPPSQLTATQLHELQTILSPERVSTSLYERVFHARGHSLRDLLEVRVGQIDSAPDVVVYPKTVTEVKNLLQFASSRQLALIPFGGGTSVVGGIHAAKTPEQQGIITLDTSLMDQLIQLDPLSRTATFQAGIYGPQLENILQYRGFTLGHLPQSFEFSTLGGWIAARGAGERSNRYGKMEELLVAAEVITPSGEWKTLPIPASAAGPNLNHLIAGSEGLFGIITQATVKIHPVAKAHDNRGFLFRSFKEGLEALRHLTQSGIPLAMSRLSDENETHFFFQFKKKPGLDSLPKKMLKKVLEWQGYTAHPSLLLTGLEGESGEVYPWVPPLMKVCLQKGGFSLGTKAGASWSKSRYATPYLRDALLDQGIGVETLETATEWSNLWALYEGVKTAIQEAIDHTLAGTGHKGFVMTHVSHCYEDGASLYFTFAFPLLAGQELNQFSHIKTAACEAIVKQGATISHHHGVGRDHAQWLKAEKGAMGMAVLKHIKTQVDPDGIMNPGKWL